MFAEKVTARQGKKIAECMLCHDASCSRACPEPDPARILRALYFDNKEEAAALLPPDFDREAVFSGGMEKGPLNHGIELLNTQHLPEAVKEAERQFLGEWERCRDFQDARPFLSENILRIAVTDAMGRDSPPRICCLRLNAVARIF